jgi:hypothetical protein
MGHSQRGYSCLPVKGDNFGYLPFSLLGLIFDSFALSLAPCCAC